MHKQSLFLSLIDSVDLQGSDKIPPFAITMPVMDTSMGISRVRLLFTALDIPPQSTSHMQKLSDKVSQAIIELNKKDMSDKLRIVEQHNAMAGQKNAKQISVSMDGRHNVRGFKSSYKPGQSSSQAYTVAMENVLKENTLLCLPWKTNCAGLGPGYRTVVLMNYDLVRMLGVHPQSHIYNHSQREGWPMISQRIFHWKIYGSGPSLLMETQSCTLVCRISTPSSVQPGQFLTS